MKRSIFGGGRCTTNNYNFSSLMAIIRKEPLLLDSQISRSDEKQTSDNNCYWPQSLDGGNNK